MGADQSWWRLSGALRRFVADLLAAELTKQRHAAVPPPSTWSESLAFDADLGVDSLELLALGAALTQALRLHASGVEDYLLTSRTLGGWLEVAAAGLDIQSESLTFRTSGSTAVAKACEHVVADLLQEVDFVASLIAPRARVLLAVPSHHIYGFIFGVLLPARLGVSGANVVDLRSHSPAWLSGNARAGDLVIGHPEYWRAVVRCGRALQPNVLGVTSTAPCPEDVAHGVLSLGVARLLQVYGASESGGVGWRDQPSEPYTLMPHWELSDDGERLVRTRSDGSQLALDAPDHLRITGQRLVVVGGRRDGSVQVGGTNVFPARVREALCRHPGVADAAVRLMAPHEGTRLKAFVVPRSAAVDALALEAELRDWIDAFLEVPARPKAIAIGAALPRNATGKLMDWPCSSQCNASVAEG